MKFSRKTWIHRTILAFLCGALTCLTAQTPPTIPEQTTPVVRAEQPTVVPLAAPVGMPEQSASAVLSQNLAQIAQKYELVGLSVLLIKNQKQVFSYYHGYKDLTRLLATNANTKYRVASVSKMFVATAIMQLYEQGKLKLDDDVSPYLGFTLTNPNFPQQPITFQKLLSHTSSLRDSDGYFDFLSDTYNLNPPPNLPELLLPNGKYYSAELFGKQGPDQNYFTYCNLNYGILGALIEKITQTRFDTYCEKNILTPLQITGSFCVSNIPDINDVAAIYRKKEGDWKPQVDNYQGVRPPARDCSQYQLGSNGVMFGPQGGLRASAVELSHFLLAQSNQGTWQQTTILKPETVRKMQQVVWTYQDNNGDPYEGVFHAYASGNHTTQNILPGQTLIGHPGEAYGLVSGVYFSPSENYGIIFLLNGGVWDKGTYSGWYNVEEEIFQACFKAISGL